MELLAFHPLYQERVWGGRALAEKLGRELPKNRPIGESWEIADRPDARSVVAGGPFAGTTLRELIADHPETVLGPGRSPDAPFPILVKWLDCRERLSLQVHPPADVATALGGEPKTENWYIADAEPGASLIVGLRRGVAAADFERALAETRAEACVHRFPVARGDSILVESGRMHAIDAGNLILEIQQNSDTTYRVYDWGRVGLDGKPRQLHVAESLRSINFHDVEPEPLRAASGDRVLADCAEFRIRQFQRRPGDAPLDLPAGESPRLLHCVEGAFEDACSGKRFAKGANLLKPFATAASLTASENATLLVTDRF